MLFIPKPPRPIFERRDSLALDCIVDYPMFKWRGWDTYDVCERISGARYGTYNSTSPSSNDHWEKFKWGLAAKFYGKGSLIDQYSRIDVGTWNVPAVDKLTIGVIVKIDSISSTVLGDGAGLFIKSTSKGATGTTWGLDIYRVSSPTGPIERFRFYVKTGIGVSSFSYHASQIVTGQWYFVVGVYDGSAFTIYVDGSPGTSVSKTGNVWQDSNDVMIGCNHDTSSSNYVSMNGNIAQAFAMSRAWTMKDINEWRRDPFRRNRFLKPRVMPVVSVQEAVGEVEVEGLQALIANQGEVADIEIEALQAILGSSGPPADVEIEALQAVLGSPAAAADVEIEGLQALIANQGEVADIEVEGLQAVLGSPAAVADVEIEALQAILGSSGPPADVEIEALQAVLGSPAAAADVEIEGLQALIANQGEVADIEVEGLQAVLGSPAAVADVEIRAFDGAIALLSQIGTVEIEGFDAILGSVAVIADLEVEGLQAVLGSPAGIAEVEVEGLDATDIEALLAEVEIEGLDATIYLISELRVWCLLARSRLWKMAVKSRIAYLMAKVREVLIQYRERVWILNDKQREAQIFPKDRSWRLVK